MSNQSTLVKITEHGICCHCGFIIECFNPMGCSDHHWLKHHGNPLECIRLLKEELGRLNDT